MPDQNEIDRAFMARALELGARGLGRTWPNPSVGAVVVRDGPDGPVIVGEGHTQPGGRPHGEAMAFEQAGAAAMGGTLYVTLEPCAMCVGAIFHARIGRKRVNRRLDRIVALLDSSVFRLKLVTLAHRMVELRRRGVEERHGEHEAKRRNRGCDEPRLPHEARCGFLRITAAGASRRGR